MASRQGLPVGFMLRRSGTLRQTFLGSSLSESPKLRLVFPQRELHAKGWRFLLCLVGRTLSPPLYSGFLRLILPSSPVTINMLGFRYLSLTGLGFLIILRSCIKHSCWSNEGFTTCPVCWNSPLPLRSVKFADINLPANPESGRQPRQSLLTGRRVNHPLHVTGLFIWQASALARACDSPTCVWLEMRVLKF